MAEEIKNTEVETNESAEPTLAELQEQIKTLMIENAKLKKASDKASSEASTYKKQLREKQSEQERFDMEKAEAEAEREEKYKELLRKVSINEFEKNYLGLGYTVDEASRMATAEVDGDADLKFRIMTEVNERQFKEKEAEWLKSRPQASAGTGSSGYTKEQFDKMTLAEKSKLYRENQTEYNRLKNL